MANLNINVDFSEAGNWMEMLVERVNRITLGDVFFIILALILPPLPVFIKVGLTAHFWINVVLTILGIVPGQIHAIWVVLFM